MAWTAWTLRNESFELDEACLDEILRQEDIRRRQSDPAVQAVYHDLFDVSKNPTPAKGTVGFVFEPYGSFHVTCLSYVGKMLGAAYARTLRDDGYAVRAISYWGIEKSGLPAPSEVPVVVVFSGRGYGIPAATVTAFKRYRNAGGRLIWIGGRDEHDVTGMKDVLVRRADEEVPVSSKWAIQNEAVWGNMKVTFVDGFGDLGGQTFRFVRNPNFRRVLQAGMHVQHQVRGRRRSARLAGQWQGALLRGMPEGFRRLASGIPFPPVPLLV